MVFLKTYQDIISSTEKGLEPFKNMLTILTNVFEALEYYDTRGNLTFEKNVITFNLISSLPEGWRPIGEDFLPICENHIKNTILNDPRINVLVIKLTKLTIDEIRSIHFLGIITIPEAGL